MFFLTLFSQNYTKLYTFPAIYLHMYNIYNMNTMYMCTYNVYVYD